jgi:hypothetical protein
VRALVVNLAEWVEVRWENRGCDRSFEGMESVYFNLSHRRRGL